MLKLCTCGFKSSSVTGFRRHIIQNDGHLDVQFILDRLIIRGDPKDEERIAKLRAMKAKAGME